MQRIILSVYCLLAAPCVEAVNIDHAEEIMTQRYKTEREASQLQLSWQTESDQLDAQIALYQHEYTVLKEKLALKQQQHTEAQAQREVLLRKQIDAEAQTQEYAALLDSSITKVTYLWPWLPISLQSHLSPQHTKLVNEQADLAERMLALTDILKQVEQFDQKINLHLGEMIVAGQRWQTEQLYIGLAQAFYRLPDGSKVGVGIPSDTGWQWHEKPDMNDTINHVFAVYKQQRAPQLIALPIRMNMEGVK